jgi:hypothetical protein
MDPPPLHRYRLAGGLTEIRASDLAFTVPEAGQLMDRHGITLTADSLECLTWRTEGWAAGLRLAAISMGTHPDADQFIEELVTENSAVTGYLVAEVLNPQRPAVPTDVSSVARAWPIPPPSSIPVTRRRRSPQRGKAKQKRSGLRLADLSLVVIRDGGIPLTWHASRDDNNQGAAPPANAQQPSPPPRHRTPDKPQLSLPPGCSCIRIRP